jgi:hypothetical protein
VNEVSAHGGSRKADQRAEFAHGGNQGISKGFSDHVINRAGLENNRLGRRYNILGGKLRGSNISTYCGIGYCVLPEQAHKVFMDGVERYPVHADREDDYRLIHRATGSDCQSSTSFSGKKPASQRTGMNFRLFVSVNIPLVPLS